MTKPSEVECSRCGAKPGERCTTKRGQPHAARKVYARTGKKPFAIWMREQMRAIAERQP